MKMIEACVRSKGGAEKRSAQANEVGRGGADDRTSKMPVRFETIDQAREKATPTV
jgi:hypothetical protein